MNFMMRRAHPKDTFLKGGKGRPDQISLHSGKAWDLEDLDINNKDKSFLNYVFSESIKAARKELEMPTTPSQTLSGLLNHHPPQPPHQSHNHQQQHLTQHKDLLKKS